MSGVRPIETRDLPRLAAIHRAVFDDSWLDDEQLERGYVTHLPEMLLDDPNSKHASPSLVFELDGQIVGFVLVACRPVVFQGDRRWMAITTHLVVLPEARSSMAGLHLLRAATSGPQDFTYVDLANLDGQRALRAVGCEHLPALSLRWVKVLRAGALATANVASKLPRGAGALNRLAGRLERSLPETLQQRAVEPLPPLPTKITVEPLTTDHVLGGAPALLAGVAVHPDLSDRAEIDARRELILRCRPNSTIVSNAVVTPGGDVIGWYIADVNRSKNADVLELIAAPLHGRTVMLSLLHELRAHDVVRVRGDLPLSLLFDADTLGCRLETLDGGTMVKTSDPDLLAAFRRSSVWMGALEGEFLWDPPSAVPA